MPHEAEGQLHWHEPSGLEPAGLSRFQQPPLAYDRYMAQEALPVMRTTFITCLLALERSPWRRLGGKGVFIQPFGTEGGLGCALLELPASGALRAEKHLFEEVMLVLEGRGTTEIWIEGSERVVFEWQPGSLFSIPPNALHRLVNATQGPAVLLGGSNAAALLNQVNDVDAVFANPFVFRDRFEAETGQAFDDIEPDPVRGLAVCRTSLVPDAIGCDLPLDNRHSPGYRQMTLAMTGPSLACTVGEHRPGRYAKAHILPAGMMTVCLRGQGYTYLWPERLGPSPWRDGRAADVLCLEQSRFALTGAGPGGGRWFHQHVVTSPGPLRLMQWRVPGHPQNPPGAEMLDETATTLAEGGGMIPYDQEDPFVRTEHARILSGLGLVNRMRDNDYAS